jgi:hypothetical protein
MVQMGYADSYVAERTTSEDEWDRESAEEFRRSVADAPEAQRAEELLRSATQPVIRSVIRFAVDQWPGVDASEDATWAAVAAIARRNVTVQREAAIAVGMAASVLGVLDWVDERIGSWKDQDFDSLVRARVDELLDAARRGRERGRALRQQRGETPWTACPACWALRHPADHYFRQARANTTDDRLAELLDAQIEELSCAYQQLRAEHHAHDQAELIVEVDVVGPVGSGWTEPVPTTIRARQGRGASIGDRLGLRLVADTGAPFNGTLITVRPGERWSVCADHADDATITPIDGTRRLAA